MLPILSTLRLSVGFPFVFLHVHLAGFFKKKLRDVCSLQILTQCLHLINFNCFDVPGTFCLLITRFFFLSAKVKVARKFARHICSSLRKNQIEMVKIRHVHRKEEYISSPKERKNPLRLLIFKQIYIVFFFVFLKERLYDN